MKQAVSKIFIFAESNKHRNIMHLDELKCHATDLVRLLPRQMLARLAKSTEVDRYAKELQGERLFNLLLYGLIRCKRLSQRKLEKVFESRAFCTLFDYSLGERVSHSSISERLSKVNVEFFRKAYEVFYDKLHSLYTPREIERKLLVRVDSTLVAETCNKLKKGFTVGKRPVGKDACRQRRQVKYTMGYEGFAAKLAEVLDEPAYLSEDVALPEAIDGMIKKDPEHSNLYVFDRGLSSLRAYDSMTEQHARFVGRIKTSRSMETVRVLEIPEADKCAPEKLVLDEDKAVHLREGGSRKFGTEEYRVITAHFKEPRDTTRPQNKGKAKRVENRICFITNDMELPAKEIAEIYRRRWDIEVFFRFLKQELSFSHFLSVNENGLSMNDKERIDIIDRCYEDMLQYRSLVQYYTDKNIGVSYLRAKRQDDLDRVMALYGSPSERYW